MDWSSMRGLEPCILLGIVNEKLRLECDSIDEFRARYDADVVQLQQRLASIGFHYDPMGNQFKHR